MPIKITKALSVSDFKKFDYVKVISKANTDWESDYPNCDQYDAFYYFNNGKEVQLGWFAEYINKRGFIVEREEYDPQLDMTGQEYLFTPENAVKEINSYVGAIGTSVIGYKKGEASNTLEGRSHRAPRKTHKKSNGLASLQNAYKKML